MSEDNFTVNTAPSKKAKIAMLQQAAEKYKSYEGFELHFTVSPDNGSMLGWFSGTHDEECIVFITKVINLGVTLEFQTIEFEDGNPYCAMSQVTQKEINLTVENILDEYI